MTSAKTINMILLPEGQSLVARSEEVTPLTPAQRVTEPGAIAFSLAPLTPAPGAGAGTGSKTTTLSVTDPAGTPTAPTGTDTIILPAPRLTAPENPASSPTASDTPITQAETLNTYIVFLDQIKGADPANTGRRVDAVLRSLGTSGKPAEVYDFLNGFSIRLTATEANRLRSLGGVMSVEADSQVHLIDPVGPSPASQDPITGLALTNYSDQKTSAYETTPWGVQAVWNGKFNSSTASTLGSGKYAFVIDTGVSSTTRDLNVDTQRGYNWINNTTTAEDDNGHGTHVAGTIGALANNYGVVGVAPGTSIIPLKVLDSSGSGSLSTAISAVNYAVKLINTVGSGISMANSVANLSLGAQSSYKSLDTAIYNAAQSGLRFAIAAGNSGSDVDGFTPARTGDNANVYTVSAVDNNYKMQSWSNWDKLTSTDKIDNIDYAAPGVNVLSLNNNYGYLSVMSGTSMASPHMAGLLLISDSSNPLIKTDYVTPYFKGTADPFAHI